MKIALCDNDLEFLSVFEKQISVLGDVGSVDCFSEYDKIVDFLMAEDYDVIFMDMNWGKNKTGLELIEKMHERRIASKIVCVSGHLEEYVEEIFIKKLNVSGVLAKPVKQDRLEGCMRMIKESIRFDSERMLKVKENGRKIRIPFDEIQYIESMDHYLEIHAKFRKYHVAGALNRIIDELPSNFIRCHRGFIINLDYISEKGSANITMRDGVCIPIGRKYFGVCD